jgi:2-polyprenyl-6-methoxyphenol hydroxylase-like FAD-dependent oxidoreductase
MTGRSEPFDVVVIGGGPAGSAAALGLARAGASVAVLERSGYDGPRVGETLLPEARPVLQRLGVWEAFEADAHVPSPGIVSAWGSAEPAENDFLFNPYGNGWHLDRARFDRTLAARAEQGGAVVVRRARVHSCSRTADARWRVTFDDGRAVREAAATFLIDATGRSAWVARKEGARRIVADRLVGVIGFGVSSDREDRRTLLEAAADGWWYSACLPQGRSVAAFMTDADLIPTSGGNLGRFWTERLRAAPLTSARWSDPAAADELLVRFSGTVRLDRVAGPGWPSTRCPRQGF